MSNQQLNLGNWIKHIGSFSENINAVFSVEDLKFDIPSLRNTLPKLRRIDVVCFKDEPDDRDMLNSQNLLRAFLPNVRNVTLVRVPLGENLSLQHIGTTNLKSLEINFQSDLNLVDISTWKVESCMIWTMGHQMSIRDLNRFFKLWMKGSNSKLKELSIHWGTEITPDWNVLLGGLKSVETKAEEGGTRNFIIRNFRGISAKIEVEHTGRGAAVVFTLSD
ncbi:unnamed protein product [Caenorhabditis nigoni]